MSSQREVRGGRIPLVLRLLDHQVIGEEGQLLGNVDDLVLEQDGGDLVVSGLLSGPPALALRAGGRTGAVLDAAWRRLRREEDPQPVVIPLDRVVRLDSGVHVDRVAGRALAAEQGLELWLRRHVVSHIPGALGGSSDPDSEPPEDPTREGGGERLQPGQLTLSRLLGLRVVTSDDADLGHVVEATARRIRGDGDGPLGPLRVTELVASRRHLGQELGYTMAPQKPLLLQRLLRWWHAGDRHVHVDAVEKIDWEAGRIAVRRGTTLRHPHDVS